MQLVTFHVPCLGTKVGRAKITFSKTDYSHSSACECRFCERTEVAEFKIILRQRAVVLMRL